MPNYDSDIFDIALDTLRLLALSVHGKFSAESPLNNIKLAELPVQSTLDIIRTVIKAVSDNISAPCRNMTEVRLTPITSNTGHPAECPAESTRNLED